MILDPTLSCAPREAPHETPVYINTGNRPGRILDANELTQYKEQGFLSISALAPASEIAKLRIIIDRLYARAGREYGSISNLLKSAPELRDSAPFRSCLAIAKQLLGKTAMYACDNALYKEPHGRNGAAWHQDGAFHGKYFPNNTLGFWIPLQDVTPENGCMRYIPLRKHQILLPHRPYYPNDYSSMMTDMVNPTDAVISPLRTGDAAIHGPLTLHSSFANSTAVIRRTWLLKFGPWGQWGFLAPSRFLQRARVLRDRLIYA